MNGFKKRIKFYAVGYLMGYIFSLIYIGIPNIYYIIPIKVMALLVALLIGTAMYYASEKVLILEVPIRIMKYTILSVMIIGFSIYLQVYLLSNYGVDITPFLGF